MPDSIKEKSQGIREQGGIQSLEDKIYALPELLTRNREILDEVYNIYIHVLHVQLYVHVHLY